MIWSYSRLSCFQDCPYQWFLKYIYGSNETTSFFAQYGTFIHNILGMYYSGELKQEDLSMYYLLNFHSNVERGKIKLQTFQKYFEDGLSYFREAEITRDNVLAVEKEFRFDVCGYPFLGYADLIKKDNGLILVDHKSKVLAPYSMRAKKTQKDYELDSYLRQLYLYSIAIKQSYGVYPRELQINCFREKRIIIEPFDARKADEAANWAIDSINNILHEEKWKPKINMFKCNYLCSVNEECEYHAINKG